MFAARDYPARSILLLDELSDRAKQMVLDHLNGALTVSPPEELPRAYPLTVFGIALHHNEPITFGSLRGGNTA